MQHHTPAAEPGRTHGPPRIARRALVQYLVLGLVGSVLVAGLTVVLGQHIARDEALQRAQLDAGGLASEIVAPLVTPEVLAGDAAATARLDAAVRALTEDGLITRVKVWSEDERVVYSDEPDLIGRRYELHQDDLDLFGTTAATAELSALERQENEFEQFDDEAVEVYAGFFAQDGTPLVFEAYLPAEPVHAAERELQRQLLPVTAGSTALLTLLLMPLGLGLARRVEREQRRSSRMLRTSIAASDDERRRIAQRLHDDVIQDLAGLGYALSALSESLPDDPRVDVARSSTRRAADVVRRDVEALRAVMTDIYPPELDADHLVPALRALLDEAGTPQLRTRLVTPPGLQLPGPSAVLLHRVVREAVRNTVAHARAGLLTVEVVHRGTSVDVTVTDDGIGMQDEAERGHFGLRLLADTVREAGGAFGVGPARPTGVRVTATIPLLEH